MKSYRTQLGKIGEQGTVGYKSFYVRPEQLSLAMDYMDLPGQINKKTEVSIQEGWTEQCQGVAWDGSHWLFSSNGSRPFWGVTWGDSSKAIYTFDPHNFSDDQIKSTFVIAKVKNFNASLDFELQVPGPIGYGFHVGSVFSYQKKVKVYVDHFSANQESATLVLDNHGGVLSFSHWIKLVPVNDNRVGLAAINPFDSTLFTAFGDGVIDQLFVHSMHGEHLPDKTLKLSPPIADGRWVQGGAVTEDGHIYISSGRNDSGEHQNIYCYSLLNGKLLETIHVLSKDSGQELEGICYAPLKRNGFDVQIHAVLLEQNHFSKDNIFFKSFGADQPDAV